MIMKQRYPGKDDDDHSEAEKIKELVKERNQLIGKFNLSDFFWFCKNWDSQGFEARGKGFHEKFESMMERIIQECEEARNVGREEMIFWDWNNCHKYRVGTIRANKSPKHYEKGKKEIDSIVGKTRLVEESDIVYLPYIQAITKETLILRESIEDCTIHGYYIPKKTRVYISSWAIGRDSKYWENPLEFNPERFLSEDGSGNINHMDVRGQSFNLLQFGSGRRGCPGASSLALLIIQTSIACMIHCFEWKGFIDKVDLEEGLGKISRVAVMESLQVYTILFLVWLVSTMLFRAMLTTSRTMVRLPPIPFAFPVIGHLHLLAPIPHKSFQKLSNTYGPLIYLSLCSIPSIVVSSPELAKLFLTTKETWFSNRPQLSVVDHISYPLADFTFAPYGPYWKFMKKLCMTQLLGGQTLNKLFLVRSDKIKRFLKLMSKRAESKEPVEIC
ncbi:hypothetical protein G4B88_005237 [Cannabis sativa]|uniref:Cytochrome P450 n=1 Tax=Cannabis sativa TaxID=3483 RepID=A0A7J6ENT9_CANSA|nr:hypothetical protein G4B88_005237 [Cannabis sativa]